MALGAQVGDIVRAILRESVRPLALAHLVRGLLFGLDGVDVTSQALAAATLLVIGLLAPIRPRGVPPGSTRWSRCAIHKLQANRRRPDRSGRVDAERRRTLHYRESACTLV